MQCHAACAKIHCHATCENECNLEVVCTNMYISMLHAKWVHILSAKKTFPHYNQKWKIQSNITFMRTFQGPCPLHAEMFLSSIHAVFLQRKPSNSRVTPKSFLQKPWRIQAFLGTCHCYKMLLNHALGENQEKSNDQKKRTLQNLQLPKLTLKAFGGGLPGLNGHDCCLHKKTVWHYKLIGLYPLTDSILTAPEQ